MTEETKPCPVCAETIKAAAIKCRFCGTDLTAYQAQKDHETEHTLFAGHPAVLTSAGQYVIAILTLGLGWIVYWIKSQILLLLRILPGVVVPLVVLVQMVKKKKKPYRVN